MATVRVSPLSIRSKSRIARVCNCTSKTTDGHLPGAARVPSFRGRSSRHRMQTDPRQRYGDLRHATPEIAIDLFARFSSAARHISEGLSRISRRDWIPVHSISFLIDLCHMRPPPPWDLNPICDGQLRKGWSRCWARWRHILDLLSL
jgi:hypothetical protein